MHVPMRRKDRMLTEPEALEILERAEYGTLGTVCGDRTPYNTPLSYVLLDGHIYFHCAKSGRKLDNMRGEPCVCFSAVGKTRPVYHEGGHFSLYFESAIAFGTASRVGDEAEKLRMLEALCEKYLPGHMEHFPEAVMPAGFSATDVWRIEIEEISGKAKRP